MHLVIPTKITVLQKWLARKVSHVRNDSIWVKIEVAIHSKLNRLLARASVHVIIFKKMRLHTERAQVFTLLKKPDSIFMPVHTE